MKLVSAMKLSICNEVLGDMPFPEQYQMAAVRQAAKDAGIIAALKRHDYEGWIAAEPFRYGPDGPTCAA